MNPPHFNFPACNPQDGNTLANFMPLPAPPSSVEMPTSDPQLPSETSASGQHIPSHLPLNPLFVDNVAKDFGLTVEQRDTLHTCAQLGSVNGGLPKQDLSTRIYMLGICYHETNTIRRALEQNSVDNLTQLLDDLKVRLDDSYVFSKEQTRSIRSQAQDTLYEATRTSFMQMQNDVFQKCRDNKGTMKLGNVFGNPSWEKALYSLVKRICSSVRNAYRKDLRNSICGDTALTLATFTYSSATKYKRGGPGLNLDVGFTVHNALLRRFARENPSSIGVEEVEDEDSLNDDPESSPAPAGKKRKVSPSMHGGGRVPKGKDFWSQVDAFFVKKITEFGTKNLQSAGWKVYVNDTINSDEQLFPSLDDDEMEFEAGPVSQAPIIAAPMPAVKSRSYLFQNL